MKKQEILDEERPVRRLQRLDSILEDEIKVPKGDPMDILGADLTEWIEVIQEFQAFSPF